MAIKMETVTHHTERQVDGHYGGGTPAQVKPQYILAAALRLKLNALSSSVSLSASDKDSFS